MLSRCNPPALPLHVPHPFLLSLTCCTTSCLVSVSDQSLEELNSGLNEASSMAAALMEEDNDHRDRGPLLL